MWAFFTGHPQKYKPMVMESAFNIKPKRGSINVGSKVPGYAIRLAYAKSAIFTISGVVASPTMVVHRIPRAASRLLPP